MCWREQSFLCHQSPAWAPGKQDLPGWPWALAPRPKDTCAKLLPGPFAAPLAHVPTSSRRADCHLVKCSSSSSTSSSQHPKPPRPAPLLRDQLYHLPMTVTALAAASKVFCSWTNFQACIAAGSHWCLPGTSSWLSDGHFGSFCPEHCSVSIAQSKSDPRMKARGAHTAKKLNPFKVASLLIQFS